MTSVFVYSWQSHGEKHNFVLVRSSNLIYQFIVRQVFIFSQNHDFLQLLNWGLYFVKNEAWVLKNNLWRSSRNNCMIFCLFFLNYSNRVKIVKTEKVLFEIPFTQIKASMVNLPVCLLTPSFGQVSLAGIATSRIIFVKFSFLSCCATFV